MHTVLNDGARALLSVSRDELEAIRRAVAAARAAQPSSEDFSIRFALSREDMDTLHRELSAMPHESRRVDERVEAWEDQGAVMVCVMNTFGDPVELGEAAAGDLIAVLQRALQAAG